MPLYSAGQENRYRDIDDLNKHLELIDIYGIVTPEHTFSGPHSSGLERILFQEFEGYASLTSVSRFVMGGIYDPIMFVEPSYAPCFPPEAGEPCQTASLLQAEVC